MTIKVVTDSTCDLPAELIIQANITVIPLYLNFADQGYLDGVEMSREEFYNLLPDSYPLPTTAAPGANTFTGIYEQLAEEGASEILSIHISESLSATVNIARTAAQQTTGIKVTVFDSQQLSMGTGFLVQAAVELVDKGLNTEQIIESLNEMTSRTYVFAALQTLDFLKRSGRMNAVVANLGNILRIKPILKMNNGTPTAERVRTHKKALKRVVELLREVSPLEKLALVHTNVPDAAMQLGERVKQLTPNTEKLISVDVTPVIGAHIGPGVVGFACVAQKQNNQSL